MTRLELGKTQETHHSTHKFCVNQRGDIKTKWQGSILEELAPRLET
jgi:hypothetical protein